jgi:haemagglutination activity domain
MKQELLRTGMLTAWLTTALTGAALAMPSGGTLTQGNVTVDQGSLAAMSSGATIKATEDSVIEWTDFDLAAADELHFDTINGAIINRVPAGKAALLRGKIKQTGTHPLSIISEGSLSMDGAQIDGTYVGIDTAKMTMQNSGITGARVQLRAGESEAGAGTYHLRTTAPLYLTNTFIHVREIRSMSGAVYLLKNSELNADHINLSIGADIRISYGADGTETQEEIAVTRDNTLSLWDSFVLGGDISFRAGGVGIWRGSELGAERKITPLVKNAKKPPYILTRTDGSEAKMLCGMDSGVWQKGGDVRGFSAVSFTQTPPIVPVER